MAETGVGTAARASAEPSLTLGFPQEGVRIRTVQQHRGGHSDDDHVDRFLARYRARSHAASTARGPSASSHALVEARERGGRLFFLGVGGSAANASHAVNDFRKIAGFEAYAPDRQRLRADRAHQRRGLGDGLRRMAEGSRLRRGDLIFVFSVGGGDAALEHQPEPRPLRRVREGGRRDGRRRRRPRRRLHGRTSRRVRHRADGRRDRVTPHTEAFQAVVWHLLVSHPTVQAGATKWEVRRRVMQRAVFLDRDGVLNASALRGRQAASAGDRGRGRHPAGRPRGVRALAGAGYLLVVVTNQPDVARGTQSREGVERSTRRFASRLPLDEIVVCYHDDADDCECRKPRPGHALDAAARPGASTSPRASWSATAGATSRRGAPPAAARSSSSAAAASGLRAPDVRVPDSRGYGDRVDPTADD